MRTVTIRGWVAITGAMLVALQNGESAFAQSKTADLRVSATVVANCVITTTDVTFGNYDPVGTNATTPLDADGSITLACTRGTLARVSLSYGSHAAGSTRRMQANGSFLVYELHSQANRNSPWNQPYSFFAPTGIAQSTAPQTRSVYGRILQGQDVPTGAYADEVLVIVRF